MGEEQAISEEKNNSTALAPVPKSGVLTFTAEEKDTIRMTVAKEANPHEFKLFLAFCANQGFNPLARQAYCTKMGGQLVFMAAVDGLQSRAADFPEFEGIDAFAVYKNDNFKFDAMKGEPVSHEFDADRGVPMGAWAKVRFKDGRHPVAVWCRFDDFNKGSGNWGRMPGEMIEKCARAKVLRRSFPNAFGGVYAPEELGRAIKDGQVIIEGQSQPKDEESQRRENLLEDYAAFKTRWTGPHRMELVKVITKKDTLPPGTTALTTEELDGIVQALKTKSYEQWKNGQAKDAEFSEPKESPPKPEPEPEPTPTPTPTPAPEPEPKPKPAAPEPASAEKIPPSEDKRYDQNSNVVTDERVCDKCGTPIYTAKDDFTGDTIGDFDIVTAGEPDPSVHTCKQAEGQVKVEKQPGKKRGPKKGSKNKVEEETVPCEYCTEGKVKAGMAKAFHAFKKALACLECHAKITAGELEEKIA